MIFAYAPLAAFCLFCTGSSVAHALALLGAKIRGMPTGRRVSALCVFLSGAVASYTVLIFLHQNLNWFFPLVTDQSCVQAACFFLWAAAGVLVGARWKLFLPVCALFYLLVTVATALVLYSRYGKPAHTYAVAVYEASIVIDGENFPRQNDAARALSFSVFKKSDTMLVPLPSLWYAPTFTLPVPASTDSFFSSFSDWYVTHVLACKSVPAVTQTIPLPKDASLPALYTLRVQPVGSQLRYELAKDL